MNLFGNDTAIPRSKEAVDYLKALIVEFEEELERLHRVVSSESKLPAIYQHPEFNEGRKIQAERTIAILNALLPVTQKDA